MRDSIKAWIQNAITVLEGDVDADVLFEEYSNDKVSEWPADDAAEEALIALFFEVARELGFEADDSRGR